MSPAKTNLPSYNKIIADLMRSATGPMPAAHLIAQMLAAHPSQAKKPQPAMRQHLHEAAG